MKESCDFSFCIYLYCLLHFWLSYDEESTYHWNKSIFILMDDACFYCLLPDRVFILPLFFNVIHLKLKYNYIASHITFHPTKP